MDGLNFHYEEVVDSTNTFLKSLIQEGREGVVVVAETQTQGRGRKGRLWFSPPFLNLTFSFSVKIEKSVASHLPFVSAMALSTAVAALYPSLQSRIKIKWPNDVYVDDKKLSGTLVESSEMAGGFVQAIVGVGINVNQSIESMDPEIRDKATSLKEVVGQELDRTELLEDYLAQFNRVFNLLKGEGGVEKLLEFVSAHSYLDGKKVRVQLSKDEVVEGVVTGINHNGALLVESSKGSVEIFWGDIEILV